MNIVFKPSAAKHGVTYEEAIYAIINNVRTKTLPERPDVHIFIGHPHLGALDNDWLEILVQVTKHDIVIFHAMPLSDVYRYLLYE